VSKPSFYRREGVKGIAKLQGKERGPFKVLSRDAFNNVTIDLDGVPTPFNVDQIEPAPTLIPVSRKPPSYKDDSLVYQPREEEVVQDKPSPLRTRARAKKVQNVSELKAQKSLVPKPKLPNPKSRTGGRKSHHKQYSIIRDIYCNGTELCM
jgi:hypothetical protein